MEITFSKENLLRGINIVSSAVPSKSTIPILSNLLLETTNKNVKISATDLNMSISCSVIGEIQEEGSITLPAKKFADIVRELPNEPIHLKTIVDKVTIKCGKSSFRIMGVAREEFPSLPEISFADALKIESEKLQNLILHTSFAASTDDTRPTLNGVFWQIDGEELRMVATNGHRLAKLVLFEGMENLERKEVIIPPKTLSQVTRLFEDEESIEIAISDNHLGFMSGGTVIFSRLIEGPYPNYELVIPKDNDKEIICTKDILMSAVRRMSVVASDATHRIILNFTPNTLRLSVSTPEVGEAEETVSVDYGGEELTISFNAEYLEDTLKYIDAEKVLLSLKTPERAALVEPAVQKEGQDYLCLVMPLRLQD